MVMVAVVGGLAAGGLMVSCGEDDAENLTSVGSKTVFPIDTVQPGDTVGPYEYPTCDIVSDTCDTCLVCGSTDPVNEFPWLENMITYKHYTNFINVFSCMYSTAEDGFATQKRGIRVDPCGMCYADQVELYNCCGQHLCTLYDGMSEDYDHHYRLIEGSCKLIYTSLDNEEEE